MPRLLMTSRRALLALVGASVLGAGAGCDLGAGTQGRAGRAGAPAADPDQRLLDTAATELKVVRERVLRTMERHPATREQLTGVATCLDAHLAALGEDDLTTPSPTAPTPGPTTPASPAPTEVTTEGPDAGSAPPAPDQVPDDRGEAVAGVVAALTAHTDALVDFSARAESGPFARLLAVMAAGTSQYLTLLRKADR